MSRVYVLAGNYVHYLHWCRISGVNPRDNKFRYADAPHTLCGLDNRNVFIYYETWREHPQAMQLHDLVEYAKRIEPAIERPRIRRQTMPEDTFWVRLTKLEPAVWRGLIVAIVSVLASFGILISPAIPDALVGLIAVVVPLVQALWTRAAVTPNAKVAVAVPDPINKPDEVVAGEAVTNASVADIVNAASNKA